MQAYSFPSTLWFFSWLLDECNWITKPKEIYPCFYFAELVSYQLARWTSSKASTEIRAGAEAMVENSTKDFRGRPQTLKAPILNNVTALKIHFLFEMVQWILQKNEWMKVIVPDLPLRETTKINGKHAPWGGCPFSGANIPAWGQWPHNTSLQKANKKYLFPGYNLLLWKEIKICQLYTVSLNLDIDSVIIQEGKKPSKWAWHTELLLICQIPVSSSVTQCYYSVSCIENQKWFNLAPCHTTCWHVDTM